MLGMLSRHQYLHRLSFPLTHDHAFRQGLPLYNHCSKMFLCTAKPEDKPTCKVFVTHPEYPQNGIELLKQKYEVEVFPKETFISKEELIQAIKEKCALLCHAYDKIDSDVLKSAGPKLRVISSMSVGVEHIDLNECKKLSIRVGYTPYVSTEATAELTVALLLATSRRLFEAHNQLRSGGWSSWSPVWMCGPALKGSTVGIVGFGRIGREVARKMKAFNVAKILYTDSGSKQPSDEKLLVMKEVGAERVELDLLLPSADFVIVTCALTPQTKGIFSAKRFALMKPTSIFINTGRGGVVDHDALLRALKDRKILAAGLDVMTPEPLPTNHPLLELTNCVLLPHIGSASYQVRMDMCELAAKNIEAALEGRPMPAEYI